MNKIADLLIRHKAIEFGDFTLAFPVQKADTMSM